MILLVGTQSGISLDSYRAVISHLEELGKKVVIFRQDCCLEEDSLTFFLRGQGVSYIISAGGVEYNSHEFSTIWYDHPILPKEILRYQPVEHRMFIQRQFRSLREALWLIFKEKKWLNNPLAAWEMENKIHQLSLAHQAGLQTPQTLITSDPAKLLSFFEEFRGKIVTKTLATSPILDHVIFTREVAPEEVLDSRAIRLCPAIYQENVRKDHELRITIVGEEVFVAKIISQEDLGTSVDWRAKPQQSSHQVRMSPTSLPVDVRDKLFRFMRIAGLRYGCIDMVVTPDGTHVFLEVNPTGQWYFVQLQTSMEIARAIAEELASP